jgi:hypothetical protein
MARPLEEDLPMRRSIFVWLALGFAACSGNGPGNGNGNEDLSGGGGGGDMAGGGGGGGTCCLNGAFYGCPDKASFDKCAGFDIGACLAACAPGDFSCFDKCNQMEAMSTHDPSSCNRDATRDPQCSVADCSAAVPGSSCDIDADCGGGSHCTQGKCWFNQVGSPCDIDADCGPGHCTQGCCYDDSLGRPCDIDADCASGNCSNGRCQ